MPADVVPGPIRSFMLNGLKKRVQDLIAPFIIKIIYRQPHSLVEVDDEDDLIPAVMKQPVVIIRKILF